MKKEQIEKKAHEIGWQISKHYDPNVCKQEWCEMAARDMANWLLDNMWISVEDELPPFDEVVIAHYNNGRSMYGEIFEHAEMFTHRTEDTYAVKDKNNFCIYCDERITHWIPIPKLNKI